MGRIVVHEFITLDGVIDNPAWSMEFGFDPKMGGAITQIMQGSKALLMGRNTYELFAPTWSSRTAEEDPGAPFMNESPKYVVSATLTNPEWNNSTVLGAYSAEAIRSLKESVDGDLYVSGSGTLVRALLADGLVDELHLFVYPLALGAGPRLFEGGLKTKFTLAASEAYENGAIHLSYNREIAPNTQSADRAAPRGRVGPPWRSSYPREAGRQRWRRLVVSAIESGSRSGCRL